MKLNFNNTFYLISHIQSIIISTYNRYKNLMISDIPIYCTKASKSVCILHLKHISSQTNHIFSTWMSHVVSGYPMGQCWFRELAVALYIHLLICLRIVKYLPLLVFFCLVIIDGKRTNQYSQLCSMKAKNILYTWCPLFCTILKDDVILSVTV